MKVKTLIAAVSLLTSAGAVFADDVNPFVDHSHFGSTKTRADVVTEMQQAAAKGSVARVPEYVEPSHLVSNKTRADVVAEMQQAAAKGSVARVPEYVEHNVVATRTRDEVRGEAVQAARSRRTEVGG